MKKKILALILAISLVVGILPTSSIFATQNSEMNTDVEYAVDKASNEADFSSLEDTSQDNANVHIEKDNYQYSVGERGNSVYVLGLKSGGFPSELPDIVVEDESITKVQCIQEYWKGWVWNDTRKLRCFNLDALNIGKTKISLVSAEKKVLTTTTVTVVSLSDEATYKGSKYKLERPAGIDDGSQDPTTGLFYHTKDEIRDVYNKLGIANIDTSAAPTYEVKPNLSSPYEMGAQSRECLENAVKSLVWHRYINNVQTNVWMDTSSNEMRNTQAGALLMRCWRKVAHQLPQPADMPDDLYAEASRGVGTSCCGGGANAADAIGGFIVDYGDNNKERVGHRGKVLTPSLGGFYVGAVSAPYSGTPNLNYTTFTSGGGWNTLKYPVQAQPYPSQYVPVDINSDFETGWGMWSLFLNNDYYDISEDRSDQMNATIKNLRTGEMFLDYTGSYKHKVYNSAKSTVTFENPWDESKLNPQAGDVLQITVNGLVPKNPMKTSSSFTWTTEYFNINQGVTTSIEAAKAPDKTQYEKGENLDTTGLYMLATDGNNNKEALDSSQYTVSGFDSMKAGKQNITVSLNEKPSIKTSFEVFVRADMTGIEVTTLPTKTVYEIGDTLDATGLKVSAVHEDGTRAEITGYTLSPLDSSTVGKKDITVTYTNAKGTIFTTGFKVEVTEMTGIEVTALPTKTIYITGENLDTTGMVVSAVYANGTKQVLPSYEVRPIDVTTAGEKTVTVGHFNERQQKEYVTTFKVKYEDYIQPIPNGTYTINSAIATNKVLDIDGGSLDGCANVQIYFSNTTQAQRFNVTLVDRDTYKIQNAASGKVLDVQGGWSTPGTNVWQYDDNGSDAQRWIAEDAGDGYFFLKSKCNGLYLDISDAAADNRNNVQVYSGNGSAAQKFRFNGLSPIAEGTYTIESSLQQGKVLDVCGAESANCANIQIYSANGTDAQKFFVNNIGNGMYTIQAKCSARALDVMGAWNIPGTNVWQYDPNDSAAQQWFLQDAGDGYYYLISACNGLYLDVYNGDPSDFSNVQVFTDNASRAQKYRFLAVE